MAPYDRAIEHLNYWIIDRSGVVVAAFLVVTVLMTLGFANVSTESGTEQFTEELPEFEAFEQMNEEFSPVFEQETSSTQLIQSSSNVLSKPSLLRMLEAQHRLEQRSDLYVESSASAATIIAGTIDPSAETTEQRINALERATPSEIDAAVQELATTNRFTGLLSRDFNRRSATATATIGSVTHNIDGGSGVGAEGGATRLSTAQIRAKQVVESVGGDIRVFGQGLISSEFQQVIFDSLKIVMPVVVVLLLLFLVFAYRDPIDLLLGLASLIMAIVWTFGSMGLLGIPFTQMLIAVPPLLLAVGIDFGIHSVNRYREERVEGRGIEESMRTATTQLLVAFFIVMGTTVIGFSSNLLSALPPIQDFGIVASMGIVFTALIFGVFLPAAKALSDRWRERRGFPEFSNKPLGSEDSLLGRFLTASERVTTRAPIAFLAVLLVFTLLTGFYATGVSTTFSNEDFLPPEETPGYMEYFPEALQPGEYTVTRDINFLQDKFATGDADQVTVYVRAPLQQNYALETVQRAGRDPPDSFIRDGDTARSESIIDAIRSRARASPEFAAQVSRGDPDGDGVPETNLKRIYDKLLNSPARDQALNYITEDRRSMRVIYQVESDASDSEITEDARVVADRYRYDAIATGQIVIFQAVADLIFESALKSLVAALLFAAAFLVLIYYVVEGRWTLGVVNLAPIVVTLALLAATMRYLGIPFNALTATILAVTIGLGIDYSVHATHRFIDEYEESHDVHSALQTTLRGTGGALTGSMLTTGAGTGALVLAITPVLGQFGVLMLISVGYALLTTLFVLPPTVVVWERLTGGEPVSL